MSRVPDAEGKVKLRFAIQPDGTVANPTAEPDAPSLHDASFESCLVGVVRTLKFPVTGKSGTVAYPVGFASADEAPSH